MKAVTVRQPWASFIADGRNTIETRSWRTNYRGRIAIHAGASTKGFRDLGLTGRWYRVDEYGPWLRLFGCDADQHPGFWLEEADDQWQHWRAHLRPEQWEFGAVVATTDLVDCVPIVEGADEWGDLPDGTPALPYVDHEGTIWQPDPVWADAEVGTRTNPALGDFTPGRWAWLLDDVEPTTERCPGCWGDGRGSPDVSAGPETHHAECVVCRGAGRCDPVPASGQQGLWKWTP